MIEKDGDCIRLAGEITLDNVQYILPEGLSLLAAPETTVDLSAVTTADSAAVSLLLAWKRAAASRDIQLRVVAMPARLGSLASLYGVQAMLSPE